MADPLRLPAPAYVYVIGAVDGPQKIGMAADPKRRLTLFRTGNMGDLVIALAAPISFDLAREAERYAHWLLRDYHARGEWFSVSPIEARQAVVEAIAAVENGKRAPGHDVGGPGRPPKQAGRKVKQTTVWLYPDDLDRVVALVGKHGTSEFVREAIDRELKRRERAQTKGPSDKD